MGELLCVGQGVLLGFDIGDLFGLIIECWQWLVICVMFMVCDMLGLGVVLVCFDGIVVWVCDVGGDMLGLEFLLECWFGLLW